MKCANTIISIILFVLIVSKSNAQTNSDTEQSVSYNYQIESDENNETIQRDREFLTGTWWGTREILTDKGLEIDFAYVGETFSLMSGRSENDFVYLDNIDLTMNFDLEKIIGWNGTTLSAYILGNGGDIPGEFVGAVQGISNIAAYNTWKIYELWINQSFLDEKLSLLFGLYDLNSEFDARETSGIFINPSHGIGPDLSQTGKTGPSIFPTTSLALRIKFIPTEKVYIQSALFDGVPGDPEDLNGTQVSLDKEDGLLITSEAGYFENGDAFEVGYGKYSIGGWYYTSRCEDIAEVDQYGEPLLRRDNFGAYISAEKFLFAESNDPSQGLAAFLRVGFANSHINMLDYYWGAGIIYTGLFNGRDEDIIGLAIATAHSGNKYRMFVEPGVASNEVNIEFTYSTQILPWLRIQPDLQVVLNPMDCEINDKGFAAGARFEIIF